MTCLIFVKFEVNDFGLYIASVEFRHVLKLALIWIHIQYPYSSNTCLHVVQYNYDSAIKM